MFPWHADPLLAPPRQFISGTEDTCPAGFEQDIEDFYGSEACMEQQRSEFSGPQYGRGFVTGNSQTIGHTSAAFPSPTSGFVDPALLTDHSSPSNDNLGQPPHSSGNVGLHSSIRDIPSTEEPQVGLPRRRSRYFRATGPGSASAPIPISYTATDITLDPMQRWRESPPEAEAASLTAIFRALKDALPHSGSSNTLGSRRASMGRRAASTVSGNSAGTNSSSRSAASSRSTTSAAASIRPRSRNSRRRAAKTGFTLSPDTERRPFPCTFCCDSFRTKYDWSRHETSLHLSLKKWVCTPHGGTVVSRATGRNHCAYCNMLDPTPEHLETHSHDLCQSNTEPPRFNRKGHLVQHLRRIHHLDTLPIIDDWIVEAPPVVSRCGFCNLMLGTWGQRADHLAQHFNEGKTMDDWRGEHCFEPSIAAQVINALPPYVLGAESKSFAPFSATNPRSKDHIFQMKRFYEERQASQEDTATDEQTRVVSQAELPHSPDITYPSSHTAATWLTLGLGRFAQRQMRLGIVPTDEMFQDESRRLLFGSEDGWEQTIADNNEWLASFRMRHVSAHSP